MLSRAVTGRTVALEARLQRRLGADWAQAGAMLRGQIALLRGQLGADGSADGT